MAPLWMESTAPKKQGRRSHKDGERITFTTSRAQVEAGLELCCPFCHLLHEQMLEDLDPRSGRGADEMRYLKRRWDENHVWEMWFEYQQTPPYGLDRMFVAAEGQWGGIGYHMYTTSGENDLGCCKAYLCNTQLMREKMTQVQSIFALGTSRRTILALKLWQLCNAGSTGARRIMRDVQTRHRSPCLPGSSKS